MCVVCVCVLCMYVHVYVYVNVYVYVCMSVWSVSVPVSVFVCLCVVYLCRVSACGCSSLDLASRRTDLGLLSHGIPRRSQRVRVLLCWHLAQPLCVCVVHPWLVHCVNLLMLHMHTRME